MQYHIQKLTDPEHPGTPNLLHAVHQRLADQTDSSVFGIFTSLLGLASNELYLVTAGEVSLDEHANLKIVETTVMEPTIRPVDHSPRTKPGIYVFRWFSVAPENVEEIVRLSGEAWPSFEADFAAEIQGLFVESADNPEQMLLITWYEDLTAWQTSRAPAPDARENFLKRHKLTKRALPIATLLYVDGSQTALVSHQ